MPSKAFDKFEKFMLKDVNKLIKLHDSLSNNSKGKRGLGHLTRSGIFMLCAAWELYVEELLVESALYLTNKSDTPADMPVEVQKTLANYTKNHSHELKVLELSGDGWKECLVKYSKETTDRLNTPNEANINNLYYKFIGLESISENWTSNEIDNFIKARGDIAHQGSQATYVRFLALKKYLKVIELTALETDNKTAIYLRDITPTNRMPWRRRV